MLQNFPLGPLGPSRFERGAAVSTMIPAAPRLDAFVSGRTQFMAAAVTLIGPATLSSDRSLFQGVLMAAFRIGNAQEAQRMQAVNCSALDYQTIGKSGKTLCDERHVASGGIHRIEP